MEQAPTSYIQLGDRYKIITYFYFKSKQNYISIIRMNKYSDARGSLLSIKNIPFEVNEI